MRRQRNLMFENGDIVPTFPDLESGAAEIVSERINEAGQADILSDNANDVPIVDIEVDEDRYKIKLFAAAFPITFQQMRAYDFAESNGRSWSVRTTKQSVAARVIATKANSYSAYGDSRLNTTGMVNDPNVNVNTSTFNPFAGATTADDLIGFVVEEIGDVRKDTNIVETPDQVLIGVDLDTALTSTRVPDSGITVKQYLINTIDWISAITAVPELNSDYLERAGVQAAGTNRDRVVLYPQDPLVIERHIEVTQLVPEQFLYNKGLSQYYPMFQAVSPTLVNYPGAMRYIDHAMKTP